MSKLHFISLILSSFVILSCTTTPSQDSDFTVYGDDMEGPGLFSGESGQIVFFDDDDKSVTSTEAASGDSGSLPGLTSTDWQEFLAFKRWLNSKQNQDESYLEFRQWLEYQQYRQWQNSQ